MFSTIRALITLLLLAAVVPRSYARDVRVLNIAWLSKNGTILKDIPSLTSSMWIPLAIQHFNDRSDDVLPLSSIVRPSCNATLSLVGGVHDDEQSQNLAMRIFLDKSGEADILLGPVLSLAIMPVAAGATALGLPQLSFGASADDLSDKTQFPDFFRVGASDAQSGRATAILFEDFGYKRIGVISVDNEFGIGMKAALQSECRKRGIELFVQEYQSSVIEKFDEDAIIALRNMKTLRLNVIIYAATRFEFIHSLAKAAKELDWVKGKLYISHVALNDYGTVTPEQIKETYGFLNGSLHIQSNVNLNNDGFRNLQRVWPTFRASDLNPYIPAKFHVTDEYFAGGQETIAGRGWAWAYDSVITMGMAACGASASLADNLRDVDFVGTSGRVKFVSETQDRDPVAFFYTLSNLRTNENVSEVTQPNVGTLMEGGRWNITLPIMYNTGFTLPPKDTDLPVNVIDRIPFGAKIYGWIGSAIALLSSIFAFGYIIKHRKERIIVESQPMYLCLLAIGCALMAVSIIALTIETDGGCMGFPWLFSAGLTLTMASLTVKSARIAIYWRHRGEISNFKRILGTRILPAAMWIILMVDLAILLAWQLTAPWTFQMVVLDEDQFGYPLRSSMVCTSSSSAATDFIGGLIGYMIFVALITGWVSFWVRNAPRRYHEAKMTALAGVSMFQVFLMAAPAAFAVWLIALPRFLVLSSMSFLLCMIILSTMFAPKIFKDKFLGPMGAKTAATKKGKGTVPKTVTFGAHSETTIVKDVEDKKQQRVNDDASKSINNSSHVLNLAPPKVTADWKLMILGIRSEGDSDSPPDYDFTDSDSPLEHERRHSHSLSPIPNDLATVSAAANTNETLTTNGGYQEQHNNDTTTNGAVNLV